MAYCSSCGGMKYVIALVLLASSIGATQTHAEAQDSRGAKDVIVLPPPGSVPKSAGSRSGNGDGRPQPFGFHVGMTEQEVISAAGKAALYERDNESYGVSLTLKTAPKPNSHFDGYILKISDEGMFELRAFTPSIRSASNGAQVKDEFADVRDEISSRYGTPKCYELRDDGTSEGDEFFMMYLERKEQRLNCYWDQEGSSGKQSAINLEAKGMNINEAMLVVTYQFYPEFEHAEAKARQKGASSF